MMNCCLQDSFRELVSERAGATPVGQLRALLDVVDRIIDTDEYQGCIFVNVAMAFPLPHDPAHVAAAKHKQAIEENVRDLAAGAGCRLPGGDFRPKGSDGRLLLRVWLTARRAEARATATETERNQSLGRFPEGGDGRSRT